MVRITERRACGQRRTYQAGCRCELCTTANADYSRQLRLAKAKGRPILGSLISAATTKKLLKAMRVEGFTTRNLGARCGLRQWRFWSHTNRVTLRKALQVQSVYQQTMLEL